MQSQQFRINEPDVINQVIDGEAVVLHLGTGRYYSARGCGADVWCWLSASVPVPAVIEALASSYDASPDTIAAAVDEFVTYLLREGLIVGISDEQLGATPSPTILTPRPSFEVPVMEAFGDLEDLLLLDPVHEVSAEKGWPHVAPEGGSHG
jgi:hypothetical protein